MKIISRKDAESLNLKRYFTGKPCKHGHISERLVSSRTCFECKRKYDTNHKEEKSKYDTNHKEEKAKYYIDHKEEKTEYDRKWRKNNPRKIAAYGARRRSSKLQRTPAWTDLKVISEFYNQCPDGYVVDHVIPLQGKEVSGLHVAENLQYLTSSENSRKSNKFEIL